MIDCYLDSYADQLFLLSNNGGMLSSIASRKRLSTACRSYCQVPAPAGGMPSSRKLFSARNHHSIEHKPFKNASLLVSWH